MAKPRRLHRGTPRETGGDNVIGGAPASIVGTTDAGIVATRTTGGRSSRRPEVNRLYFRYFASQSRNVSYQNWLFCGFRTQWPSSGKSTSFDGTPCRCSAEKNSISCV